MSASFQDFARQLRLPPALPPVVAPALPVRHRLVLAGPGAGKTSLLVDQAARHLARGCPPQAIVMLAFTRAAAQHLRACLLARVGEVGAQVWVRTFHGLASDIVAHDSGRQPRLASWVDQPQQQAQILEDALKRGMERDENVRRSALNFFAWHLHPAREALDFSSWEDLRAHLKTLDLRTLAGERVRSRGEWLIANWLFLHGIDYVYERPIPPGLLPDGGQYRPDFFLPDHGVYIEHLGLDRKGQPPAFMNPARYLESLAWKRAWHATQPTRLAETFAFESAEGLLPTLLPLRLAQAGVVARPLPWEVLREKLSAKHTLSRLANLAGQCLRLLGAGGETVEECQKRLNQNRWRERNAAFLQLLAPLAAAQQAALVREAAVDFDALLAQATTAVTQGRWQNPFALVLVDEAQDLSPARAALVRVLTQGARLFAVGDDRQSIFHFSGSDGRALRDFKNFFGTPGAACEISHLRRTFRLGASLTVIAENFIAKNPRHQHPPMRAAHVGDPNPVRVVRAKHPREGAMEALAQISAATLELALASPTVLLLARYGATLRALHLEHLRFRFSQLAVKGKTIHAAKGMEADFAVVLDLVEGRFPSHKTGDPLLQLAQVDSDPFPDAEERRLFFVALTRARHGVWLVADKESPSPFVAEVCESLEGHSFTHAPTLPHPPPPLQTKDGKPMLALGRGMLPILPATPDHAVPTCA